MRKISLNGSILPKAVGGMKATNPITNASIEASLALLITDETITPKHIIEKYPVIKVTTKRKGSVVS